MSAPLAENRKLKVMVLGAAGQLGHALQNSAPIDKVEVTALTRSMVDVGERDQVVAQYESVKPDVIINASAYTAVDKAESEESAAFKVNSSGPENIARAIIGTDCKLFHVSTDFVFDGAKSSPYLPGDETNPIGVYGKSKLEGERILKETVPQQATIIRTSWLYSGTHPCFLGTMLRLMKERPQLGVVADQVGTPTSVDSLAEILWKLVFSEHDAGIYHWSDAGVASWYDFAVAIQEQALALGLLEQSIEINPLKTEQYPTPAKRPSYSVLDKTALYNLLELKPVHWQKELQGVLQRMNGY